MDRLAGNSISTSERTRGEFRFVDVLAPGVLIVFLALQFGAFLNIVNPPGVVSSLVIPGWCLGVLACTPAQRLRRIQISLPLVAVLLWLAATYLWSAAPASTLFLVRSELLPTMLVSLVAGTIEPDRLIRTLVGTFSTIVVFSLAIAVVWPDARRVVYVEGLVGPQEGFRGTFQHKNLLGIFTVLTLALQLAFLRGSWRRPLLIITITTLLLTRSATAGSGMMVVLFMWSWLVIVRRQQTPRGRSVVVIVALSSVVLAVLLALRLLPALLGLYQKDITFSGRTDIWAASVWVAAQRPWTGHGLGALFGHEPPSLTYEVWRRIGFEAAHAHNGPLALLVDAGIIGLASMALLLVAVIAKAILLTSDTRTAPAGQWVLMSLSALLFMSISEPLFTGPNLALVAVLATVVQRLVNDRRLLIGPA